jgi:L-amino acid N-acyltransferase YncA
MAAPTVRPALASDAPAIAAVHVQAWRETYAHLMPADFLAALDVERRTAGWTEVIADGVTDVFVALDGEDVVGWATAGPGRAPCGGGTRELEGIYLLGTAYGSGAAQQLLDAAVAEGPAHLWMADDNPRAEAFYRRNGFSRDGAETHRSFGSVDVRLVRMTR